LDRVTKWENLDPSRKLKKPETEPLLGIESCLVGKQGELLSSDRASSSCLKFRRLRHGWRPRSLQTCPTFLQFSLPLNEEHTHLSRLSFDRIPSARHFSVLAPSPGCHILDLPDCLWLRVRGLGGGWCPRVSSKSIPAGFTPTLNNSDRSWN
jgi:hypothetical protein